MISALQSGSEAQLGLVLCSQENCTSSEDSTWQLGRASCKNSTKIHFSPQGPRDHACLTFLSMNIGPERRESSFCGPRALGRLSESSPLPLPRGKAKRQGTLQTCMPREQGPPQLMVVQTQRVISC